MIIFSLFKAPLLGKCFSPIPFSLVPKAVISLVSTLTLQALVVQKVFLSVKKIRTVVDAVFCLRPSTFDGSRHFLSQGYITLGCAGAFTHSSQKMFFRR